MAKSVYDFSPEGYREWFINTTLYDTGDQNKATVVATQDIQGVLAISCLEAQIPFTFYPINSNNNIMRMRERTTSAIPGSNDAYTTVTITPGYYNSSTIGLALTTAFSNAGLTGTYSVSYNSLTGKITIASSNRYFDILFTNEFSAKLCTVPLGFDPYTQANVINVQTITPPHVIQLGGPTWVLLRGTLGIGSGDTFVTCDDGTSRNMGNIIATIPVNCQQGGTITWSNPAPRGGFFKSAAETIKFGTFWLTSGDDDYPLDLNGQPFQLKLGFLTRTETVVGSLPRAFGNSTIGGPPAQINRYFAR